MEQNTTTLVFLAIVALAYLATHLVLGRLQRRFLFVSGFEYLVLGLFVAVANLMGAGFASDMQRFFPIVALAAGWFALLRGMELEASLFQNAPAGAHRLGLLDDLAAGAAVGAASFFSIQGFLPSVSFEQNAIASIALGCCAATGSTDPIDVLKKRYHVEGKLIPMIRRSARIGDVGAMLVFGLALAVFHPAEASEVGDFWSWPAVVAVLGAVLGLVFSFFLGGDESDNSRFLALVGIITFAAGAAFMLEVSVITVTVILGAVLVTVSKKGRRIQSTLESTERPMSLLLYIFAGAMWTPPESLVPQTIVALVLFLVVRTIGKALGSTVSALGAEDARWDMFRGLMGQGDVALAMAIAFKLIYSGEAIFDLVYTVILASVIVHDLIAPRLLRGLLWDAGQTTKELEV